jgi:putative tributyrin esterase
MCSLPFPWRPAVLLLAILSVGQAQEAPRQVTRVTFLAPSVAREMAFNIILPAGYESSGKRYPALYLLHGRNQDLQAWPRMGVAKYAAGYELIVVIPDAGNSWYVNWAESSGGERNDWADYIVKDLIGYIDAHYRTVASRSGRAIDGYSMGGYGALYLAFSNPELFCSVNSHSGGLRGTERWRESLESGARDTLASRQAAERESMDSLKGVDPQGRMVVTMAQIDAIDPYKIVGAVPRERLPDIRIDCGIDERLAEYSQRLAKLLMELEIPFTYAQAPGLHNEANWSVAVEHSMAHQYAVMMKNLGR